MTPGHMLAGSVSGGCIEGAVFEEGMRVLQGAAASLLRYGVADETVFEAVGLACGGSIEVFVEPFTAQLREFWRAAVEADRAAVTATVVAASSELIGFKLMLSDSGAPQLNRTDETFNTITPHLLTAARLALQNGRSVSVDLHVGQQPVRAFVDVSLPASQLIIVGGVHIAQTLCQLARSMGYRVVIIDPRSAFGNAARFPGVDRLLAAYPKEALASLSITRSTAIVTLTHDSKFDDPALVDALRSEAFYVGALGGKTTLARRRERLLARGLTEAQMSRLHAPIGLDLGARTPEEIALAVMAQIIAARNGVGAR
jgi:xanthine dehydrogenase accessory factor